jgi:branched-chain amino acid transport system permease protein
MRKPEMVRGGPAHKRVRRSLLAVLVLVALTAPFLLTTYRLFQVSLLLVYACALLGLNLIIGYNGQISIAHGVFFAIGGYSTAILVTEFGWPAFLTWPVGAILAFALGYVFGIPALRLPHLRLALITLVLAVATPPIIRSQPEWTRGSMGIVVPRPSVPDFIPFTYGEFLYFILLAATIVMAAVAWNFTRGRVGRAMMSIREHELAAMTMGVNHARVKVQTFAVGCAYAAIAGSMYVWLVGFVAPDSYTLVLSVNFLVVSVLGGLGSFSGAFFGAAFLVWLSELAEAFTHAAPGIAAGALIVLVVIFAPHGIGGLLRNAWARMVRLTPPPYQPPQAAKESPPSDEQVSEPQEGGVTP